MHNKARSQSKELEIDPRFNWTELKIMTVKRDECIVV